MNKQKIVQKWLLNNGAASFDFKKHDIIFHDGGLFSITKSTIMLKKCLRLKKLKNGYSQMIFSKKKYPHTEYKAYFWFEELDETINYLRRMKKMLNSIGYKTNDKKK